MYIYIQYTDMYYIIGLSKLNVKFDHKACPLWIVMKYLGFLLKYMQFEGGSQVFGCRVSIRYQLYLEKLKHEVGLFQAEATSRANENMKVRFTSQFLNVSIRCSVSNPEIVNLLCLSGRMTSTEGKKLGSRFLDPETSFLMKG